MTLLAKLPLSLYIHIPWCVRKCPYCDFNSHAVKEGIPEQAYVGSLLTDLYENAAAAENRPLQSIFFGGGTPSLFSAQAIENILNGVQKSLKFAPDIEITLEANPGTLEQGRFKDYRSLGVNRLSLGVQSLNNEQLKRLGRIHDREAALRAVQTAQDSGFDNLNIDLMYGLPEQSTASALLDLEQGLALKTPHLSWYQLTLEPNTEFYHQRPPLPEDEALWEMQNEGQALLAAHGFQQYEVSAYAKPQHECRHNLNYWLFGDYLGIGAGAHSKLTHEKEQKVYRHWQHKNPRAYMDPHKAMTAENKLISEEELVFEFMLNALRLNEGASLGLFEERTGVSRDKIESQLKKARGLKLLTDDPEELKPSEWGRRFLNNLTELFLPSN